MLWHTMHLYQGIKNMKSLGVMISVLLTGIMIFASCHNSEVSHIRNINVDLSSATDVDVDSGSIVCLETNDSSLLYSLGDVVVDTDRLFVYSRGKIKCFDKNGRYMFTLSRRGSGPGEFSSPSNLWIDNGIVKVFDNGLQKILYFDRDGHFIDYSNVNVESEQYYARPNRLFPSSDGNGFYSFNTYMGISGIVSLFSRIPSTLDSQIPVEGRISQDGGSLNDGISIDNANHRALYWEGFRDTIFSVYNTVITPMLAVDFGEHSIPQDIQADNDLLNRIERTREAADSSYTYPRYVQASGKAVYFYCSLGSAGYIVRIDERNNEAAVYRLNIPGGHYTPASFMKIAGDTVLVGLNDAQDMEQNPAVAYIPLAKFQ